MYLFSWMAILLLLFIGCSGNQNTKENPTSTTIPDKPSVPDKPDKPPVPDKPDKPSVPDKPPVAISEDIDWIYVMEALDVDEKIKSKTENIVKEKWLADKKYKEVPIEEYQDNLGRYVGKKVLRVKLVYAYAVFDLSVASWKLVKDNGDFLESPLEGPGIPNHRIPRAEDEERLFKEIGFLK